MNTHSEIGDFQLTMLISQNNYTVIKKFTLLTCALQIVVSKHQYNNFITKFSIEFPCKLPIPKLYTKALFLTISKVT